MRRFLTAFLLLQLTTPVIVSAQMLQVGASAALLATRADPIAAGESRSAVHLTQPVLTLDGSWLGGTLALHGMVNLEGLTLDDGELAPGTWGEGFMDRRHPHTYLHELVASARIARGGVRASLSAGRGFVPFGTDDPMSRAFLRFPTDHHLAQIPERLIAIAAVGSGQVVVEVSAFNGDEPTGPRSLGSLDRFGDSWATRVTIRPLAGLELQGSHAAVESPEVVFGGGANQRKWSASARWDGTLGGAHVSALGEWARTMDEDQGVALYGFRAWLLEVDAERDPWRAALRYEDATRPEEERTVDRFHSPRPHTDFHLLGITRWQTLLGHIAFRTDVGPMRVEPFVEAGISRIRETTGGVFDPANFFGSDLVSTLSTGIRIGIGHDHERMGRYGVAIAPTHDPLHANH